MKRKLTEVEYNQLSVESIIGNRISTSTLCKYKSHLIRLGKFLGVADGVDFMAPTAILDKMNEETLNSWLQQNLLRKLVL